MHLPYERTNLKNFVISLDRIHGIVMNLGSRIIGIVILTKLNV